jgi:hypothetical protein
MSKLWVVTVKYNDYDQHGEYFVSVFTNKPTFQELKELTKEDDITVDKLTKGGGRQDSEYIWYYLKEVETGSNYHFDGDN